MFSLVNSSDGPLDIPSGGLWTVPRTVSRIALREDPRTAPQAKDRNYDLSTGLHTYGVSYPAGLRPSRTNSYRNPDSLTALRNYFV